MGEGVVGVRGRIGDWIFTEIQSWSLYNSVKKDRKYSSENYLSIIKSS